MGLDDILAKKNNKGKTSKQPNTAKEKVIAQKEDKEVQHPFTIRHDVSTKVLLDRLQKLKELTTPGAKSISQGSILREALELLAKEMEYEKLQKKYAEFLAHINEDTILNKPK